MFTSLWVKKVDPVVPSKPMFQDADRCLNCGHLSSEHENGEGTCLREGGGKYLENAEGSALRACACEIFVPVPKVMEEKGEV